MEIHQERFLYGIFVRCYQQRERERPTTRATLRNHRPDQARSERPRFGRFNSVVLNKLCRGAAS